MVLFAAIDDDDYDDASIWKMIKWFWCIVALACDDYDDDELLSLVISFWQIFIDDDLFWFHWFVLNWLTMMMMFQWMMSWCWGLFIVCLEAWTLMNHNEERIEKCHTWSDDDNLDNKWFVKMINWQLIAVKCVSPGLGCTRLAWSGSAPPHDGCTWQHRE